MLGSCIPADISDARHRRPMYYIMYSVYHVFSGSKTPQLHVMPEACANPFPAAAGCSFWVQAVEPLFNRLWVARFQLLAV